MKMRMVLMMISLTLAMTIVVACGSSQQTEDMGKDELPLMTMEEVANNNGLDGKNAYLVVDGIVYDVTDIAEWSGGEHNGYKAGQDLTNEIKNDSPHGVSKLNRAKKIGRIEE